jgi:hypothetical protein
MPDTRHRFCTFPLKSPPKNSDDDAGKKEKEKKTRKGKGRDDALYTVVRLMPSTTE